ncbi:MAG TPA: isoaspartyl peptidase/L-asparaginase, partial [Candidatus Acidoferrum sp.]|nr:isoaspartyl peptidase/L-asparaginase [Candidatus Acidoferrum sp.]
MARARNRPALVAHGGAGSIGPSSERPERRRAMMAAIRIGARILRTNGTALDAVVATVAALEDHPLFNAGYGSLLNSEGNVEMDASVMFAEPAVSDSTRRGKHSDRTHSDDADYSVSAGA